ncbi:MAG TPA: hypothetical protein PK668_07425 [Myxococcota bacterium]|nr:hypothetical protein [Myxococcota bacterium]HRY92324.1 hypothetical protein [Myxococcota bacterium]HSA21656.1 hypothetical protein [Myxococcota bacterium]
MAERRESLERIVQLANDLARQRGFRMVGVYHLIEVARQLDPPEYLRWLGARGIPEAPFAKALEFLMRPRRAAGGVPRDRQDAALREEALAKAAARARAESRDACSADLGAVLADLSEEPLLSLCERLAIDRK